MNSSSITVGVKSAIQPQPETPNYDRPMFVNLRGRVAPVRLVSGF